MITKEKKFNKEQLEAINSLDGTKNCCIEERFYRALKELAKYDR